jgi:hypothetical protein
MDLPGSSLPAVAGGASSAAVDALLAVLRPLARLAIDHGVQFGQLEELAKRAMVEAAIRATDGEGAGQAPISRLSVITGIHRKEVKRLADATDLAAIRASRTPAAELFTRWLTDPAWCDPEGRPRELARRLPDEAAPSFETLARSVTTDVHPRTLLDELLRLGLAEFDPQADSIRLRVTSYVPASAIGDLLTLVGDNVGAHLAAARDNVAAALRTAHGGPPSPAPFVEQALYADALSPASAARATVLAREQWGALLRTLAPVLQRLEDEDRAAGRPIDRRVRIGLYSYSDDAHAPRRRGEDETTQLPGGHGRPSRITGAARRAACRRRARPACGGLRRRHRRGRCRQRRHRPDGGNVLDRCDLGFRLGDPERRPLRRLGRARDGRRGTDTRTG